MKEQIIKILKQQREQLTVLEHLIGNLKSEYRKLKNIDDDLLLLNIESDIRVAEAKRQAVEINIKTLESVLIF
ncbi:MAG: hypothetical protein L3J74_06320 [Bacteroidales bacterium]|nr:hypothetical protein [Bacteroidales bacterium]